MILENKNNNERILIRPKSRPMLTEEESQDPKLLFLAICDAIREGGYDPVSQVLGYIISEDPTHITNYKSARTMIGKLDRDDLLREMVEHYIDDLREEYDEKSKKTDDN